MKRFSVLVSIMAASAIVLATAKAPASQVVHEPSQLNLTIPLMAERREPDRPAPRPSPH